MRRGAGGRPSSDGWYSARAICVSAGCAASSIWLDSEILNHRVEIVEGVLAAECVELVKNFFDKRR